MAEGASGRERPSLSVPEAMSGQSGARAAFWPEDIDFLRRLIEFSNQGRSLREICRILCEGTRQFLHSNGATVYLLSDDKEYLIMQNLNLTVPLTERLQRLVGIQISTRNVRLREDGLYRKALRASGPVVFNDPESIRGLIAEYVEDKRLERFIPRIYRILKIDSVVMLPLVVEGEAIGLLELSRPGAFPAGDIERLAFIAPGLTSIVGSKRAEEALAASERKYRVLVENNPDGIAIIQKDTIKFVNKRLLQMVRLYEEDEMVGRNIHDFFSPDYRDMLAAGDRAREQGKAAPDYYRLQALRADGTEFDADVYVNSIEYLEGTALQVIIRDISEHKRAGDALKQSEEKIRLVFDSIAEGIIVTDLAGNVLQVNDAAARMYGYDGKESAVGVSIFGHVAESDRAAVVAGVKTVQETGHFRSVELNLLNKDGTEFPAEVSITVMNDSAGTPVGLVMVTADITERRRMEELYRILAYSSPFGISIVQENKFVYVNPEFRHISGYTSVELLGTDPLQLIHPEDRQIVMAKKKARKMGEQTLPYELRLVKKNGEIVWVLQMVVYIRYRGAHATLNSVTDITERKRMGEALFMKNTLLTAATETMLDGILVVDESSRIVLSNKRFQEMWAVPQELIDTTDCSQVLAYLASQVMQPDDFLNKAQQFSGDGDMIKQHEVQLKDGRTFQRYSTPLPDGKGGYQGRIWYFRDITERKKAKAREQQLQEEVDRSSRLAAIGQLASGVAHELNNPLTVVLGFSQRLMRKTDDEAVKRDLEKVYHEAQRAAKVVQNLLTFARHRQPERALADINEIVQKTLELREYELKSSNIEVVLHLAPNLPEVMVDFQQIQEVFLNIILNAEQAIKRTSKGGGRLIIRTELGWDDIVISFKDTGPGIAPRLIDQIFNPFFSTGESEDSAGLGLSICHGIVSQHGGRVYARSQVGEGATFVVQLPLAHS